MKQKELFDNYTAKSSSPALRASDLKSPSTDILDSRKIKDLTAAEEITDMVILIERLGDIVISIKSLYDKLCVDQKQISSRDAMSLLLDMGLRNPMLSKAADMFDDYVEFSKFLYVYCSLAGVTKPSRFGKTTALSDKKYLWIPTISGMWEEIDNDLYEALYRAAEPYKLRSHKSGDSDALAKSREKENIHSSHFAHELWVSLEEASDIMMMTGFTSFTSSEVTIGETIRKFRHFLPGVPTGKYAFRNCFSCSSSTSIILLSLQTKW